MTEEELKKWIVENSDKEYQKFASSLLPDVKNIYGVRLPKLHKLAKKLSKQKCYMNNVSSPCFEEIMLQAFTIAEMQCSDEEKQQIISDFIPKIDNWSVCDSFCCSLKCVKSNPQFWWKWIQQFIFSSQEFEIRFGLVMLIFHFIDSNYLPQILNIIPNIKYDKYYSKMALAWLIAECYIKYPNLVINFLKNNNLSADVHNKAIQKICESKRIENKIKQQLKEIKK
ncbi:MAG: DNA alkylation repair protein [Alphaproteobacteria bacterium]|nr:DNA alkylation repair protein [Alphaproteobacteria bacterium]